MMEVSEDSKKKRRIPEDLRKRALVSCDRCKKRRVRCLRAITGSAQQGACQSCLENGVKCESTLPRKQRIYGSVETLSLRYRVLDALINGLFPNHDTSNIDVLYEIAERNHIEVPSGSGDVNGEDILNQSPTRATSHAAASPLEKQKSKDLSLFDSSCKVDQNAPEVVEEKALANPQSGPTHYIGPSSSFGFVLTIRDLVSQYNAGNRPGPPPTKLPSDFPPPPATAKALEPIVKGKEKEASAWTTSGDLNGTRMHDKKGAIDSPLLQAEPLAPLAKRPLWSHLPPRNLADRLVSAYFDQVYPNYMILHPSSFYARYRTTWSDKMPIQDVEPGWTCVLFTVLVFGAQALEHEDKEQSVELQRRYMSLVLQRQYHLVSTSNLLNCQALLLAQLYQHNNRERNSAWMLLGCAIRMMIALGMHNEGSTGGFDSIEREMRRRVWWTTYKFESNMCMILGRPSSINDGLINVQLPDETMLNSVEYVPPGYLDYSIRLTRLVNRVKREIYDAPHILSDNPDATKTYAANRLLLALGEWYNSLPPTLRPECISLPKHNRAVHLLHIQYHHTQTLVTRPFILRKVTAQLAFHLGKLATPSLDSGEVTLSHLCCSFARQVVLLLNQLSTMGMLNGVAWMDFYYLYHAVLILALDFLARPQNQRDTAEDVARKSAVRDALIAVRHAKLCPTFTFLIQVSQQLAKIVGIFDEATLHEPQQDPQSVTASEAYVEDLINDWFQYGTTDVPWHFFGALGSGELDNSNMLLPALDTDMAGDENADVAGMAMRWAGDNSYMWSPNTFESPESFVPPRSGSDGSVYNGMAMGP